MHLLEQQDRPDQPGSRAAPAQKATAAPRPQDERAVAFAALAERQSTFLYRVAFSLLRNSEDAEDAVQEALLKLFRGEAWRRMDDERAFLARTVWRTGLDRLARAGAKQMRHAEDAAEANLVARGATPEQEAVDRSERALLRRLIEGLAEELRQPLVLSAVEGMTSAEVALTLGIPEGTVRTRLMRARTELKRRFAAMNAGKEAGR